MAAMLGWAPTHDGIGAILRFGCGQPGVVRLGAAPALHFGQALFRPPLPPLQLWWEATAASISLITMVSWLAEREQRCSPSIMMQQR